MAKQKTQDELYGFDGDDTYPVEGGRYQYPAIPIMTVAMWRKARWERSLLGSAMLLLGWIAGTTDSQGHCWKTDNDLRWQTIHDAENEFDRPTFEENLQELLQSGWLFSAVVQTPKGDKRRLTPNWGEMNESPATTAVGVG